MSKPSDSAGSKKRKIDSGKTSTTKKPRTVQKKVEEPTTIVTDDATKAALSVATTFAELNLSEPLQKSLNGQDATTLAPIQRQAIPALLTGQDVSSIASHLSIDKF
jgi:superfamily II DNA/RNA helicase